LPAQVRVQEHQLHRLFVIQTQDRRRLQRENSDGDGFAKAAQYHAVLLAALEYLKEMLLAARVHTHAF